MTHPRSAQETYIQHLCFASTKAAVLFKTSLALLIHGILPFYFVNYTTDKINQLSKILSKRKSFLINKLSDTLRIPSLETDPMETVSHRAGLDEKKNNSSALIGDQPSTLSILDFVGNTPILPLLRFNPNLSCKLHVKCEMFNPTLSIKDRIVLSMIKHYEQIGTLRPGATIYEASSGNTGCSLAMIASLLGYNVVIIVPKKTSQEKINIMRIYGATVIICEGTTSADSPEHYTNKAKILSEKEPGSLYFNQYGNDENAHTHYRSTAVEIWKQMNGNIDYLIAPASSGGTITGIGRFMKEKNPNIKIILPDPIGSIFYDYFHGNELAIKSYEVEGAGKDKICDIHDFSVIDDVIQFTDEEAFHAVKRLATTEGLLVGGSSGGALVVAEKLTKKILCKQANIVVILPDSGIKYLSKMSSCLLNQEIHHL